MLDLCEMRRHYFNYSLQHPSKHNEYRWFTWSLKWQTAIALQQDECTAVQSWTISFVKKRQSAFIEYTELPSPTHFFWCEANSSMMFQFLAFKNSLAHSLLSGLLLGFLGKLVGDWRREKLFHDDIWQRAYLWAVCCPTLIKSLDKIIDIYTGWFENQSDNPFLNVFHASSID